MRFNVLIVDNNLLEYTDFNSFIKNKSNLINISFSSTYDVVLLNLQSSNLVIINPDIKEHIDIINRCEKAKIPVVVTTNKISDELQSHNHLEFLEKPLNYEKLYHKIEHYLELKNKDFLLKKEQELSNSILNNITYPIFSTDGIKVNYANFFFYKLISCISLDEINKKYKNIGDIFISEKDCLINTNDNWLNDCTKNTKVCILDKQGNKKFFSLQNIYLIENKTNLIILNDITHEIQHKNDLYNLLYTDNLTQLPNRTKLIDELQNKQDLKLQAICIIDINSFKEVNDFFGHKTGDSILKEVGYLIKENIEVYSNLKLYKFPSDTYCITNTDEDEDSFLELLEKIIDSVYKKVFIFDHYEIDIRITAGISFSHKNNKLITADIALQSAKKDRKDYMVFYDELDKFQEYENNMLWTKKLKAAFSNDNIEVYYQPLINNKTMKVEKYECLVRLIDEDGKVISPFFFLDISKKSNQYRKITKIVLEKSFKKFEHLPFEFSVNVSYEDIEDPEFIIFIKDLLLKYNVRNKVVFEILEDENIKNYSHLIGFVDEIKELGCKVAIDDFGSGYSNFEHLLKMKVDYLKIDASLIKNIANDENSYKITKTIIEFAKTLNLKTIAEFVENEEIFNLVKEMGADFSQGYYFSAPLKRPESYDISVGTKNE